MTKFVKFALVGASGALINLGLFFLLVDRGGTNPTISAILCFAVAVTWNYFLDHWWTFRSQIGDETPSGRRYLQFVGVSVIGLAVNIGGLNLVILVLQPSYKVIAQAAGIAFAMGANYTGANLFAFRPNKTKAVPADTRPPRIGNHN